MKLNNASYPVYDTRPERVGAQTARGNTWMAPPK